MIEQLNSMSGLSDRDADIRDAAVAHIQRLEAEAAAWRWGYKYLQDRMHSIDRHGWAEDCDSEILARIDSATS